MAKRFTDTDKWKRPWFANLDVKSKLVWLYVLDQCDHCGVWPANFKLMSLQLGFQVTQASFEKWMSGKVRAFDGDKYFIPSFVTFQQGVLSETKNAHKPIFAFLSRTGFSLTDEMIPSGSHPDPILMGPSIGIGKGKGYSSLPVFDFESVYREYPRKEGKSIGLKKLKALITTQEEFDTLLAGTKRFAYLSRAKEPKYIPLFSTFVEQQRWLDSVTTPAGSPFAHPAGATSDALSFEPTTSVSELSDETRKRIAVLSGKRAEA